MGSPSSSPPRRCHRSVAEESLLDALAGMTHHSSRALSTGLTRCAWSPRATRPWSWSGRLPARPSCLRGSRVGAMFGPKVGVFVHTTEPDTLPPERRRRGARFTSRCPCPEPGGRSSCSHRRGDCETYGTSSGPNPWSPAAPRLAAVTALSVATASRSAACSPAGRPRSSSYAALASVTIAALFERRLLLATIASLVGLAFAITRIVLPQTAWYGVPRSGRCGPLGARSSSSGSRRACAWRPHPRSLPDALR